MTMSMSSNQGWGINTTIFSMMRFSNSRIDTLKINLTRSILVLFVATTWLLGEEIVLREDFRESPAHIPIAQQDLTNGRFLSLQRLGSSSERLKLSYHPNKANDPHYLWNGMTSSPSAVLFHFDSPVDLSAAQSRIRVRTKNVGGSTMHLALKIGDDQYCRD